MGQYCVGPGSVNAGAGAVFNPRQLGDSAGLCFSHRPWKVSGGESHQAGWKHPWKHLDSIFTGADCRILFFELTCSMWIDIEDGEATQLAIRRSEDWTGCQQVAGLVQIGQMHHVGILKFGVLLLTQLRSVTAKQQQ